jgi:hypothetical protein
MRRNVRGQRWSRFGVRQLLAAFRLPEPGRPVECATVDALSTKTMPGHFPVSPVRPGDVSEVLKFSRLHSFACSSLSRQIFHD